MSMVAKILQASCVGVVILVSSMGALAQEQSATGAVTLRDALTRALDANPNLRGQRFTLSAADARIDQAAQRPPYEIGLEAENILGTDRLSTFDDAELTLQLSTVLELGGKRTRRVDAARFERDVALNQSDAERLDVIAEVTRRFIRLAAAQEELRLAQRRLDLANRTFGAVEQRVKAARSPLLENSNASVAVDRADLEFKEAESSVRQAWAQLAAMWGETATASGLASAELFDLPDVSNYAALSALVEQNPDIVRFASERRVQEAKLRLAEAQRTPDLTLSAGVRRLQGDRSNAFVISGSIPLGGGSRAAPYVAEAQSLREGLQFREQAARTELLATLLVATEQLAQHRTEVSTLATKTIPQATEAQKLAEQGYNVGRFSLLELIAAQEQLADVQRQAIQSAAAFHQSLLEIERLTGRSAADRGQTSAPR